MRFIDSHTHIYLPEFDSDRELSVARAAASGVEKLLMPNIDLDSIDRMLAAEVVFPGICHPMMGLHPTSVREDYIYQLDRMEEIWSTRKFIAVGEIGIDLYWDKTFINEQKVALKRQIELALREQVPVVVHSRDSFPEVFGVLDEFAASGLRGVLHAFTGTEKDAEHALRLGFMLGIGGIVTFKNSGLDQILHTVGPENLIIETDSPYLAPAPHRGRRNESSYIPLINKKLAEIYDTDEKIIASLIFENSVRLFNL
jgi:TatD DNase family protein